MLAPVYRNIDTASTLLGLAVPFEAGFVAGIFGAAVIFASPSTALAIGAVAYVAVRLAMLGKPSLYLQHRLLFAIRKGAFGGRMSAAARTRGQPRFPFAPFASATFTDTATQLADTAGPTRS